MRSHDHALRELVDRAEILRVLCNYARGVDRQDWQLVRAAYHVDAYDDHGEYKGDVDGLIEWLARRFAGIRQSTHVVGNCVIDFTSPDEALAESCFVTSRLQPVVEDQRGQPAVDTAVCRQSWGRYLDHLVRRRGEWRIARRSVHVDAAYRFVVQELDGHQVPGSPSSAPSDDRTGGRLETP